MDTNLAWGRPGDRRRSCHHVHMRGDGGRSGGRRWWARRNLATAVLVMSAAVVALFAVGVAGFLWLERSFAGECGRDVAAAPGPGVSGRERRAYERENAEAHAALRARFGAPVAESQDVRRRCDVAGGTQSGDVVAISRSGTYAFGAPRPLCDAVADIESTLRSSGWEVAWIYTTDPAGSGWVGVGSARRATAQITLGLASDLASFTATVDARALTPLRSSSAAGSPFPMSCPR